MNLLRPIVSAMLASALAACGARSSATPRPEAHPAGATPAVAMARGQVEVEGGLLRVSAPRDGVLVELAVDEGDDVEAGQTIAVIDQRAAQLTAAAVRAELAQLTAQLGVLRARRPDVTQRARRAAAAAAADVAPDQSAQEAAAAIAVLDAEIGAAESAVDGARQRLKAAEFEIEVRNVRALEGGRIVRRNARRGDAVSSSAAEPIVLIAPKRPRVVRVEVDEEFVGKLRLEMTAEVTPEGDETQVFRGRLRRIGEIYGRRTPSDLPNERADARVVSCIVTLEAAELRIGQRVVVRFNP